MAPDTPGLPEVHWPTAVLGRGLIAAVLARVGLLAGGGVRSAFFKVLAPTRTAVRVMALSVRWNDRPKNGWVLRLTMVLKTSLAHAHLIHGTFIYVTCVRWHPMIYSSLCCADHVSCLFGNHDHGRVGVATDHARHDGRIHHAQPGKAVHAQLGVHHVQGA